MRTVLFPAIDEIFVVAVRSDSDVSVKSIVHLTKTKTLRYRSVIHGDMQVGSNYKITTQQVLARCDIRSGKTLTRWRQAGLLPEPSIETHPNGRGKIAYYPHWICHWIRWVRRQMANGASLDEIAKAVKVNWRHNEEEIIIALQKQEGVFPEDESFELHIRDSAWDSYVVWAFSVGCSRSIYEYLRDLGVQRPGNRDLLQVKLQDSVLFNHACTLLSHELTPYLVLFHDTMYVLDETSLISKLRRQQLGREVKLVMPIRKQVVSAFKSVESHYRRIMVDDYLARVRRRAEIRQQKQNGPSD